jgi:hypothetical protein
MEKRKPRKLTLTRESIRELTNVPRLGAGAGETNTCDVSICQACGSGNTCGAFCTAGETCGCEGSAEACGSHDTNCPNFTYCVDETECYCTVGGFCTHAGTGCVC